MLTFARLQLFELFLEASTISDIPSSAQYQGSGTDIFVFKRIGEELLIASKLAESLTLDLRIDIIDTTKSSIVVHTTQQRGTQCIVISRFVTA